MNAIVYIVTRVARYAVITIQLCMFVRAMLSWFPIDDDNPIFALVFTVTEPFVIPFRLLLDRFGIGDDAPIDIAFLMTIIALSVLTVIL